MWDIYSADKEITDYEKIKERYNQIETALWNSKLPYEDKLSLLRDGQEYVDAISELQGISRNNETVTTVQFILSLINRLHDNSEVKIACDVAGIIVPAAENAKNATMKPSLEETIQIKERRLLQLLEKAKQLENEENRKKLKEKIIPFDDSTDVDFGIDIPPEVAEWYYKARLEEAKKRGIDIQPIMDPSGVVYEALEDNLLEGVTATLWYAPDEEGIKAEIRNADDYDQINPQITGKYSGYAWDVPTGYRQVRFEKDGFLAAQTDWLPVPSPQLNIKTAMVSTEKPQITTATAYPDYIELVFSQYMDTEKAIESNGYSAEWTVSGPHRTESGLPKRFILYTEAATRLRETR